MMTEVKPWEPVSYAWVLHFPNDVVIVDHVEFPWDWSDMSTEGDVKRTIGSDAMIVDLSCGQKIIVRALSEERKAARRMRREGVWGYSQNLQLARSLHESDDTRRAIL